MTAVTQHLFIALRPEPVKRLRRGCSASTGHGECGQSERRPILLEVVAEQMVFQVALKMAHLAREASQDHVAAATAQ